MSVISERKSSAVPVTFVAAYRKHDGTRRYVLRKDDTAFALVVKVMHDEEGDQIATTKVWDLTESSLEEVISHWHTRTPFKPDPEELADALAIAQQCISQFAGLLRLKQ